MKTRIPFENSKFEKVRIRFLISEKTKSKIQVGDAKPKDEAKYPFFTSGENILSFDEFLCDNQTIFLNDGGVAGVKFYDGKVAYSDHTYAICSKNENICFTKFLFYSILCNLNFIDFFFFKGSALRNLEKNKFKNFKIPLPPLNEQKEIAEFLDKKCEIIDKRLSNLERKIKSLKEYKKSLISECVTKGLNPKNIEFKDSGIPWIGQIPKHWEVTKIKYVIDVLTDYTANGSFADLAKNVQYLDYEDYARLVRLTDLRENLNNFGIYVDKNSYEYLSKSSLFGKEILVANVGAYSGLFWEMPKVKFKATLAPNMFMIKTNKKIMQHYFYYLGISNIVFDILQQKAITTAQPKLNKTDIKTIYIPLPPLNEQKEIAEFLDKKCEKIDRLNENYTKQITALKEYKKSLIYECVTGKKEI
ncbi:restriction endonuclease subunit S [Campylobacter devanensis]|uniref:restriction endonuclease subunit S n=1 Tax=Campylobacter devanensis TaxID=3161138 RepID=UPI000A3377C6|nr:restriction endonuclease subunit S [Campylobacter sp. P148]